jgi:hypothetical protein
MEHDESHAFQHAPLNSVDQGVTDLLMGNIPPPEEYVGIVEELSDCYLDSYFVLHFEFRVKAGAALQLRL